MVHNKIIYSNGDLVGRCIFIEETLPYPEYNRRAIFKCICGENFEANIQGVKFNNTLCEKCGKIEKSEKLRKASTRHGFTATREHGIWRGMINRCTNPNAEKYYIYGGKGIKVCEEWLGKNGFVQFLQDMGSCPSKDHSIERMDNDGDYCKSNCKWATRKEQCRNRSTSRIIDYKGESKTLAEWAEITGINYGTLLQRINQWKDIEKAFTTPIKNKLI